MKNLIKAAVIAMMMLGIGVVPALAVTELPDPNTVLPDGSTIAHLHDDFYAYSALLNTLMGYEGFDVNTGTGGLDVLFYTGANGQDNDPVQGGFVFPNPLQAPTGGQSSFSGVWGPADGSGHSAVTVDNMLAYLHTFGTDINTPIFNFDMNQTGANPDLQMLGHVWISDPNNSDAVIAEWAFDDGPDDNIFENTAWILAEGTIDLGGGLSVDHNKGSGKLDYIGFAPTMNLDLYDGNGYLFNADFRMQGLNNGHEELYITGAFVPADNIVPEPASLVLWGLGLAGLAMRKKIKKI